MMVERRRSARFAAAVALVVAAVLGVVYTLAEIADWPDWLKDVSLALASNLFTAVIIFLVIDQALSREQQATSRRFRETALARLRHPIQEHVDDLMVVYKVSSQETLSVQSSSLTDVFDADFVDALGHFDAMSQPTFADGVDTAALVLARSLARLADGLDSFIDVHAGHLEPADVDAVVELREDTLVAWGIIFQNITEFTNLPHGLYGHDGARSIVETHLGHLLLLIEVVNDVLDRRGLPLVEPSWHLWSTDLAPETGAAYQAKFERFVWFGEGPPPETD